MDPKIEFLGVWFFVPGPAWPDAAAMIKKDCELLGDEMKGVEKENSKGNNRKKGSLRDAFLEILNRHEKFHRIPCLLETRRRRVNNVALRNIEIVLKLL